MSGKRKSNIVKGHETRIIYTIISLIVICLSWFYGETQPFNGDELIQISVSSGTFSKIIQACASGTDAMPPLFGVAFSLWYRVVPYGERWLYLFPAFFVGGSIFLIGIISEKIKSPQVGMIACFLAATSTTMFQIIYELRPYAFLLFFSSLSFLFYILRSTEVPELSLKKIILFGISLTFLVYSHYYAIFICVGYFIADLFLWGKKKIRSYAIFSYIMVGILFLPWAIYFLIHKYDISSWFQEQRTSVSNIIRVIQYLTGNLDILFLAFTVGSIIIIYKDMQSDKIKRPFILNEFITSFSVYIVWGIVLLLYFYGSFFDPRYNIFRDRIMIERYFCGLFPFTIYVCALVFDFFLKKNKRLIYAYIFLTALLTFNMYQVIPNLSQDPGREAANWLLSQENISNPDTIVATSSGPYDSFRDYYINKQSKESLVQVVNPWMLSNEILENAYVIYYYGFWALPNTSDFPNEQRFLELYELKEVKDNLRIKIYVRK